MPFLVIHFASYVGVLVDKTDCGFLDRLFTESPSLLLDDVCNLSGIYFYLS